jgi:hypothetical protein
MSSFKKQIKTKKTKEETKELIQKIFSDNSLLKSVVSSIEWEKDQLFFNSKIGNGFLIINDNLIEFQIELNFMGKIAYSQLDKVIDEEFAKLEPPQ